MLTAIGTTVAIPLCRVPDNDPVWIKRILDAGAMGIVVPMACSAEEAANAVSYAK
jgi:2-keto-3-deoxy-L-rhamnonate aldolase RhmA